MDGEMKKRTANLERLLRTAHAERTLPALDPGLAARVVAEVKAAAAVAEKPANGVLWRLAAGAGVMAAASVVLSLAMDTGMAEEAGRTLFYDPTCQLLLSLFG